MSTTNNLNITKVEQGQSQKEVTVNQALDVIDALLNTSVIDRDLTDSPVSPNEGDLYIPASPATGDWTGNEGKLAHFTGGSFQFITPNEGLTLWLADEDIQITFDGSNWISQLNNSFLRIPVASTLTISSGVVTATNSHHKIDTEGSIASDDLDTINAGAEGDVLVLEAFDASRTVVLKHGTGNIRTFNQADISLDDYGKAVKFFYDGGNWIEF